MPPSGQVVDGVGHGVGDVVGVAQVLGADRVQQDGGAQEAGEPGGDRAGRHDAAGAGHAGPAPGRAARCAIGLGRDVQCTGAGGCAMPPARPRRRVNRRRRLRHRTRPRRRVRRGPRLRRALPGQRRLRRRRQDPGRRERLAACGVPPWSSAAPGRHVGRADAPGGPAQNDPAAAGARRQSWRAASPPRGPRARRRRPAPADPRRRIAGAARRRSGSRPAPDFSAGTGRAGGCRPRCQAARPRFRPRYCQPR